MELLQDIKTIYIKHFRTMIFKIPQKTYHTQRSLNLFCCR